MDNSGYLNPLYPQSLIEFGDPLEFPASKGWILKRPIAGTVSFDGMGCYPIFACEKWANLEKDLDGVGRELVSLVLVTDPFGEYNQEDLRRQFQDLARPYKEHFVIDLQQRPRDFVTAHHQRNARKALKMVKVEMYTEALPWLDEWFALYNHLIDRHHIQGITRFSREAFARQMKIPGIVVFRAVVDGQAAGMLLWYKQNDIGYYHLGAYNDLGYQRNASFALFWTLMEYFSDAKVRWLSLGAGAGTESDGGDGLTRFKRGWSTGTRTAYLCGRIFDPERYRKLVEAKHISATSFFPAYRLGEP